MGKDLRGKEIGEGLSQLKNGTYRGRFTNRYGQRICCESSDLFKCKQKLQEMKAKDLLALQPSNCNIKLDDWFDKVQEMKSHYLSPNSVRHYDVVYNKHIKQYLGFKKLKDIHKTDVTMTIALASEAGYEYETQNKIRIILLDLFNKAIEDEMITNNPVKGIKLERTITEPFVLSPENKKRFLATAYGTFYYYAFYFQLCTGLRPGELFALTWDKIDYSTRTITINQNLVYQRYEKLGDKKKEFHLGPTKNKYSVRKLHLSDKLVRILEDWRAIKDNINYEYKNNAEKPIAVDNEEYQCYDLVFTTTIATPLNSQIYNDAIRDIINKVNLCLCSEDKLEYFGGHCFRHTFATDIYNDTKDIKLVARLLGHSGVEMASKLYIHDNNESKLSAMDFISETNENLIDELID